MDVEEKYYSLALFLNYETVNLIFCMKISENDKFRTFPIKCLLTYLQPMFHFYDPENARKQEVS